MTKDSEAICAKLEASVEAELLRIRNAIAPSDGGDKEDLTTYAKEVVRLRAALKEGLPHE